MSKEIRQRPPCEAEVSEGQLLVYHEAVSYEEAMKTCLARGAVLVPARSEAAISELRVETRRCEESASRGDAPNVRNWWFVGLWTNNGSGRWSDGRAFEPKHARLFHSRIGAKHKCQQAVVRWEYEKLLSTGCDIQARPLCLKLPGSSPTTPCDVLSGTTARGPTQGRRSPPLLQLLLPLGILLLAFVVAVVLWKRKKRTDVKPEEPGRAGDEQSSDDVVQREECTPYAVFYSDCTRTGKNLYLEPAASSVPRYVCIDSAAVAVGANLQSSIPIGDAESQYAAVAEPRLHSEPTFYREPQYLEPMAARQPHYENPVDLAGEHPYVEPVGWVGEPEYVVPNSVAELVYTNATF